MSIPRNPSRSKKTVFRQSSGRDGGTRRRAREALAEVKPDEASTKMDDSSRPEGISGKLIEVRQPGCGLNMRPDTSIVVKTVGRNPAGHQHHRHPGSRVGRSASQIKAAQAGIVIGRLKAALQSPMVCDAVDRAIKYTVAFVTILGVR